MLRWLIRPSYWRTLMSHCEFTRSVCACANTFENRDLKSKAVDSDEWNQYIVNKFRSRIERLNSRLDKFRFAWYMEHDIEWVTGAMWISLTCEYQQTRASTTMPRAPVQRFPLDCGCCFKSDRALVRRAGTTCTTTGDVTEPHSKKGKNQEVARGLDPSHQRKML